MSNESGGNDVASLLPAKPKPRSLARSVNVRLLESLMGGGVDGKPIRDSFLADTRNIVHEIAGDKPSRIEMDLAELIGSNLLMSRLLHRNYALLSEAGRGIAALDHVQRSISRSEKRATSAMRTLIAIRGLAVKLNSLRMPPPPRNDDTRP